MKSLLRTGLPALLLAALFAAMPLCALPHGGVPTAIVQAAEQTLRRGSRGEAVKTVQQKLIRWGYLNGKADGIFGAATEKAVRYFQRKNGLQEDGIVGPATFEALGMRASGGTQAGGAVRALEGGPLPLDRRSAVLAANAPEVLEAVWRDYFSAEGDEG